MWSHKLRQLGFVSLIAAACCGATDPMAWEVGGLRGILIGPAGQQVAKNGEGSTVVLKDGTLYHAFSRHYREATGNADLWPAVVATTTSHDGGKTWSTPEVLFRSSTGKNAMQPSFARLKNGELGISYSQIDSISSANKVFRYSSDEGKTWSKEVPISPRGSYWTSAHDRMLVLPSGRVLLTLHHKEIVKPEKLSTQVAYSDDNGRTWKLSPQVLWVGDMLPAYEAKQSGRSGFWEASIAQRADGSLFMIGRTYGGFLYWSESRDQGIHWTAPRPTTLPSAPTPGRVERIPGSADLVVIWNRCCAQASSIDTQRVTLSAATSSDGGKTWHWTRDIETVTPGNRVEYPAITFANDKAYLTYRVQSGHDPRTFRMQEYLAVLPVDWFYAERDSR